MPALKFRADNYSDVVALDELESIGWLKRENDHYVVQSVVLPLLDTAPARHALSSIELVYAVLRERYLQAQEAQVPLSSLAAQAQLSLAETTSALRVMLDNTIWCRGRSADLNNEDAFVSPSETILKHKSYASLAEEVLSWGVPSTLSRMGINAEPTAETTGQRQSDFERELPPAQADAVLSVVQDLEDFKFTLNDYFDDLQPQSFIDSVLSGKLESLSVYCETIGWHGPTQILRKLLPLNGNAVPAMELVKSFVIPEVRRLVTVKATPRSAANTREPVQPDNLLRTWGAVRACLQELSFYDIKEVAGLSGFDVTAAAHLVQKAQGGATKGQLMSEVDAQVALMSSAVQRQFLTVLIEELLRRRPETQEKLSEYLNRLGWTFVNKTLIPLALFDVNTLADTPDESHHDLLKAAQRLRDGDLGGAISAACGAVDAATSRVYLDLGLGDPTKASFQERCKRAALAKGVLFELDQQLSVLGWPAVEITPFKKNLEGALNQGAYVMQTLRSRMGDVHGTKPILRSLVFDCLRWAELLVGTLVERPERGLVPSPQQQ